MIGNGVIFDLSVIFCMYTSINKIQIDQFNSVKRRYLIILYQFLKMLKINNLDFIIYLETCYKDLCKYCEHIF